MTLTSKLYRFIVQLPTVNGDRSIYAKFHSKRDKHLLRTPADHPLLPNQIYLREINWETNHTWAIAKSYHEATTILQKLVGNWGSLEIST